MVRRSKKSEDPVRKNMKALNVIYDNFGNGLPHDTLVDPSHVMMLSFIDTKLRDSYKANVGTEYIGVEPPSLPIPMALEYSESVTFFHIESFKKMMEVLKNTDEERIFISTKKNYPMLIGNNKVVMMLAPVLPTDDPMAVVKDRLKTITDEYTQRKEEAKKKREEQAIAKGKLPGGEQNG